MDSVTNRKCVQAFGQKKNSLAEVTLYMPGTGDFTVNGARLLEIFPELGNREQIVFPLQQTSKFLNILLWIAFLKIQVIYNRII